MFKVQVQRYEAYAGGSGWRDVAGAPFASYADAWRSAHQVKARILAGGADCDVRVIAVLAAAPPASGHSPAPPAAPASLPEK